MTASSTFLRRAILAAVVVAGLALAGCSSAAPSPNSTPTAAPTPTGPMAPTEVCEQFGSTPVAGGRYEVQNNRWGADTPQCVVAFDTGFRVDPGDHDKPEGPAGYPSIVFGCNYGTCTKNTPFPRPLADLGDVRSSWAVTLPKSGDYNVAYDVWLDPTPRREEKNTGAELMIWLDRTDRVQPIGSKTGSVDLAGTSWAIWTGENEGTPVISYVREKPTTRVKDLSITDFVRDATGRGVVQPAWYLTNIQAGFEPWIGGRDLVTDSFSVTRNGA